jgi:hypothetical protein
MSRIRAVRSRPNVARLVFAYAAAAIASSCAGKPKPVAPVTNWRAYRAEGGGYSMEVPASWTLSERGGAGGFETTVRANSNSYIVVSKQILPPGLDAKLMRSATHDEAIIELVQGHYHKLEQQLHDFRGGAPEVGTAGSATAGFGSFTASKKTGFGGGTIEVEGATALLIGLNYLYVLDAYADEQSSQVVASAFDRIVKSFKFEE